MLLFFDGVLDVLNFAIILESRPPPEPFVEAAGIEDMPVALISAICVVHTAVSLEDGWVLLEDGAS